jgi:hypothetical protein
MILNVSWELKQKNLSTSPLREVPGDPLCAGAIGVASWTAASGRPLVILPHISSVCCPRFYFSLAVLFRFKAKSEQTPMLFALVAISKVAISNRTATAHALRRRNERRVPQQYRLRLRINDQQLEGAPTCYRCEDHVAFTRRVKVIRQGFQRSGRDQVGRLPRAHSPIARPARGMANSAWDLASPPKSEWARNLPQHLNSAPLQGAALMGRVRPLGAEGQSFCIPANLEPCLCHRPAHWPHTPANPRDRPRVEQLEKR